MPRLLAAALLLAALAAALVPPEEADSCCRICQEGEVACGDRCVPAGAPCSGPDSVGCACATRRECSKICRLGKPCGDDCVALKAMCPLEDQQHGSACTAVRPFADYSHDCCKICSAMWVRRNKRLAKPCGDGCIAFDEECLEPAGCACAASAAVLGYTEAVEAAELGTEVPRRGPREEL